jgi:hypothetical protein
VLIAADLSLALPGLHWSFSPALDAALAGAWFVALADLVSVWVGFLLCPWEPYPLNDPPITTMSFYVAVARQRSSGAGNV